MKSKTRHTVEVLTNCPLQIVIAAWLPPSSQRRDEILSQGWERPTLSQCCSVKANSFVKEPGKYSSVAEVYFPQILLSHTPDTPWAVYLKIWGIFLQQFLSGEGEPALTPMPPFKEDGRERQGKMKTFGVSKIKSGMAHMPSPNDEGGPRPAERKRTPFCIHLAACPDLTQPKSLPIANLSPAN